MIDANTASVEVFTGLWPMQARGSVRPAPASREARGAKGAAG